MVAVEMRNHHQIDGFRVQTGGRHVAGELPDIALARGKRARAVAGIDHNQLAPGIDHQRREMDAHLVFRQKRFFQRGADFVFFRVEHEAVAERKRIHAVRDSVHLCIADPVAIVARRLLIGERHRRSRRRVWQQRVSCECSGSGKCVTSCQFHDVSPSATMILLRAFCPFLAFVRPLLSIF